MADSQEMRGHPALIIEKASLPTAPRNHSRTRSLRQSYPSLWPCPSFPFLWPCLALHSLSSGQHPHGLCFYLRGLLPLFSMRCDFCPQTPLLVFLCPSSFFLTFHPKYRKIIISQTPPLSPYFALCKIQPLRRLKLGLIRST